MVDLAKDNKPSFKVNKRFVRLLVNLPGLWLIYHLFTLGLKNNNSDLGFEFMNHAYRTGQLIEDYQKYRNNMYFFYAVLMIGVGFLIITRKNINKVKSENGKFDQENWVSYVIPASVQGIILTTFSYAVAGFLLDIYFFIKRLI